MLITAVALFLALVARSGAVSILGRSYWEKYGKDELEASLKVKWNTGVAKNIIVFVGDGMGPNSITAGRIYRAGEESFLSWERFPHMAALKTYAEDKTVTDSAASGTSLFTGVKTNYHVVGLSGAVKEFDCKASQSEDAKLIHITTLAQAAGKSTGIVTTTKVTDATPAATFARSASRSWQCSVPADCVGCKDIGRQLVEDLPGRNFNVIMGGGRYMLQHNLTREGKYDDCRRLDGRDLITEWAEDKATRKLKYAVVNDTGSLLSVDIQSTDYLLGIFGKKDLKYHYERDISDKGTPSLKQMATAAINILMKNKNGFFLMVENQHIDLANHEGRARPAISEVVALHDTISATMTILEAAKIKDDTLVIVTSDHSHTLTISGYPPRGSSIVGIAEKSEADGVPYTTLSYGNGAHGYHYSAINGTVVREDPSTVNTSSWDYHQQVAVLNDKNSHGGNDVLLYATGPYAHLFHHMHEQTYVNTVMKFAAKLGEFASSSAHISVITSYHLLLLATLYAFFAS